MTTFIELTLFDNEPCLVQVEHISAIFPAKNSRNMRQGQEIMLESQHKIYVLETQERILAKINEKTVKPM